MNKRWRAMIAIIGISGTLSGCSSLSDWISPAEIDPPAKLQEIEQKVRADAEWTYTVGVGDDDLALNLAPVYDAGQLYVADARGQTSRLDAQTGKVIWSVDLDLPASGGPGVGEGLVLLGTRDAEVLALAAQDGAELWRTRVSSEVLAPPVASNGRVVVRTLDGKVVGLDAATGERRWIYERDIPVLTLRGSGKPVISGDSVICGLAGGKVVSIELTSGDLIWEATVSLPAGRSELERLADIDGDPLLSGGLVYVATYQGEIAAISEASGDVLWRRKFSSYSNMAIDRYNLYAADADGLMWALDADNGSARWKQEALRNRRLSAVVVLGGVVAVGDFEGYVHLLSSDDGSLIGRTRVGSDPITRGMLVRNGRLFIQGDGGRLEAISLNNAD